VLLIVHAPDGVIRADPDAVGPALREEVLGPGADEATVALVDDHPWLVPRDDVHAILRVDPDTDHVLMGVAGWQLLPALD
jgi:hypothetical protein